MALQSLLVVRFRDHVRAIGASLGTVLGLLLGGGIALAALATLIGAPILDWLSGGPTGLGGIFMGILVVSSALVAALTIGGAAVLARSQHFVYSIGWVTAAIVTIVIMALGLPFIDRIEFALLVGPASGLLVFVVWLLSDTVRARKRVERIGAENDARLARGGSDGR
jgi:O-antigen/teichoic acid export membrane protein